MSIDAGIRYRPPFGQASDASLQALIQQANSASRIALNRIFGAPGLSVKAFGATGDGVTDDTAAIHACRDAAGIGGVVIFPAGTYAVTGLIANLAFQSWEVMGGAVIQGNATAHALYVQASGVIVAGPGTVKGVAASGFANCMVTSGLSDVQFINLEVTTGTHGIRVKGVTGPVTTRIRVTQCRVHDLGGNAVFFNWETTDSEVSFCQIYTVTGNGVWSGETSDRQKVFGNTIIGAGAQGIGFNGTGGATGCPYSVVLGNVVMNSGTMGVSIDSSDGCKVGLNTVLNSGSYGVELAGSARCNVDSNTIDGASYGVSITALNFTCHDSIVSDNEIRNTTNQGVVGGGGSNGGARIQVTGNKFIDCGPSATGAGAILATFNIGCNNWLISDNHIYYTSAFPTLASAVLISIGGSGHTVEGNEFYIDPAIVTGGGTAIQMSSAALNTTIRCNTVDANAKMSRGIFATSAAATGCVVDGNTVRGSNVAAIDGTNMDISNTVSNNTVVAAAGSGLIYGASQHWDNRSGAGAVTLDEVGPSSLVAPAAGAAAALPATPAGYLTKNVNGTNRQFAYY